jgi:muramidase (phage lysozyme)
MTNLNAFLEMIAVSEIGRAMLAMSDNGYNVICGSTPAHPILFRSYAAHPNRKVIINSKGLVSSAAGRYQFMPTTWNEVAAKLKLHDFTPASQDAACVELIKRRGAYDDVVAGRFTAGLSKCRKEWASLPGADYDGQHMNTFAFLQDAYTTAGGKIA